MIKLFLAAALLMACAAAPAIASAERLVLVTDAAAAIPALSSTEVRKLFLGKPLVKDGVRLRALRNETDALLREVFLQKVMFLSAHDYERQLLSNVFREGGERPAAYEDAAPLLDALQSKSGAVTYMWEDAARAAPNVKIVGELWQGTLQ